MGSAAFLWPWLQIFLCLTEVDGTLSLRTVVLMALGPVVADSVRKESACVVEVTCRHRLGDWLGRLQNRWTDRMCHVIHTFEKYNSVMSSHLLQSCLRLSFTNHSHICNQGSYTRALTGSRLQ